MNEESETDAESEKPKRPLEKNKSIAGRLVAKVANHPILLALGIIATLLAVGQPAMEVINRWIAPNPPSAPLSKQEESALDAPAAPGLIELGLLLPYGASVDLDFSIDGKHVKHIEGKADTPMPRNPKLSYYTIYKRFWERYIKPLNFQAQGTVFLPEGGTFDVDVEQNFPWHFMEGEAPENFLTVDFVIETTADNIQAHWEQGMG